MNRFDKGVLERKKTCLELDVYDTYQFPNSNLIFNERISIEMVLALIRFYLFTPCTCLVDIGHLSHDADVISIKGLTQMN